MMNQVKESIDLSQTKTILLDLGGVVFQSTGKSNEKIDWDIINQLNEKYGHDLNTGKSRLTNFLSEYSYMTNQFLGENEFLSGIFDTLDFNQELIDLLKSRYEIIVVSDNYRENIEYISERFKFSEWAREEIYSYDYQMFKSNKKFFKRLLEEVGVAKEELLLIDDSQSKIDSAASSGIKGILFESTSQIEKIILESQIRDL